MNDKINDLKPGDMVFLIERGAFKLMYITIEKIKKITNTLIIISKNKRMDDMKLKIIDDDFSECIASKEEYSETYLICFIDDKKIVDLHIRQCLKEIEAEKRIKITEEIEKLNYYDSDEILKCITRFNIKQNGSKKRSMINIINELIPNGSTGVKKFNDRVLDFRKVPTRNISIKELYDEFKNFKLEEYRLTRSIVEERYNIWYGNKLIFQIL